MSFSRVRAPQTCPLNFYFIFVLITHWYFVEQNDSYEISFKKKITTKNTENMLFFGVFWKWLKFKTSAREVKTQNNKNPRDTILYYVLFHSFDIISHHVTHYPGSLSPPHVRISWKMTLLSYIKYCKGNLLTKGQQVLTFHIIINFDVWKYSWTFSGCKILSRTKDTLFWSWWIFPIQKLLKKCLGSFLTKGLKRLLEIREQKSHSSSEMMC